LTFDFFISTANGDELKPLLIRNMGEYTGMLGLALRPRFWSVPFSFSPSHGITTQSLALT